ncbi:hypothetical protein [Photobacterium galatheae]|uniref:Outer membrane protein beta-barrel domain-containing protein n=1 Tax=Photobacterium galatheae TaxID=1654360 RepID=A0A066RR17_9GAMM|nr:hypothetical protein [Photobacterium galatheae]KDM91561.1 hypothetical protein EA58_11085 [Photobacterium galatheae]MCM0149634.1 hypothetical protein [Photobacterium galatheae]
MYLYNKYLPPLVFIFSQLILPAARANTHQPIYITPYWGYAFPDHINADGGIEISPEKSDLIGITIEGDYGKQDNFNGRIGFTTQHLKTNTDGFSSDDSFTFFHFQASSHYYITSKLTSFIGLSLGGTLVDASWSKQDVLFSGGGFFGSDFFIDKNIRIRLEARWLASNVDGKTNTRCETDSGTQDCEINIDNDWLSFYQTNLGISFVF